ncbi:protein FAM178B-like [Ctenodactylus gundi]
MSVFLPNLFGSLMDHPLYQDLLLPSQQLCSPSVTPTPKSPKMPKVQTPRDTYPINWSPSRVDFFNLGVVPAPWDAPDQGEESTVGNRSRKRSLEELDSEPEEDLPTLEELFGNVTDLSQLAAAPQVDSHTSASCQGSEPYINSLDYLLWEKREQPLEQEQERLLLQDPLDLRPSDVNKDSVLLTPEHRMLVERFSVSLKVIPQMHPGETIFLPRHHPPPCFLDSSNLKPHNPLEELFLRLSGVPFVSEKHKPGQKRSIASPVQQLSFLHSGLLSNLYLHTSDLPVPLLQWLFQLLTWPPETSSKAFGLLWELSVHGLFCQSDKDIHLWCPSLQDILEVFHGLGAHDLTLCPQGPLQHGTRVLECDIQEQQDPPQEVALDMSLSYVYKFLMLCILARPRAYTDASLLGLLELLCRTSLDMGLCLLPKTDLQQLLLLLLDRIDEWPGKLQWLCCMLSCMSNHHHNLLALVRFFPDSTSRSRQLRSQLSLVVIARILGQEEVLTVWSEKSQLLPGHVSQGQMPTGFEEMARPQER